MKLSGRYYEGKKKEKDMRARQEIVPSESFSSPGQGSDTITPLQ
jgi:hypothetical protein